MNATEKSPVMKTSPSTSPLAKSNMMPIKRNCLKTSLARTPSLFFLMHHCTVHTFLPAGAIERRRGLPTLKSFITCDEKEPETKFVLLSCYGPLYILCLFLLVLSIRLLLATRHGLIQKLWLGIYMERCLIFRRLY